MALIDFHTHRPTAEGVVTPRCFGVHPWGVTGAAEPQRLHNQLSSLTAQFEAAEMIGECGLDRCCDTPWQLQMEAFEWQIVLAERLRKPLVVHCVRAFNDLLALRKRYSATPWVVHGFTGSAELYGQMLDHGIEASFGAAILDPRRKKVRDTLASANPMNIFLETDDSGANIAEVYSVAAEMLHCDEKQLRKAISNHYHTLLGI